MNKNIAIVMIFFLMKNKMVSGHLLGVVSHTLVVDKVKLASIGVEFVKRRDRLLVETPKPKPRQI